MCSSASEVILAAVHGETPPATMLGGVPVTGASLAYVPSVPDSALSPAALPMPPLPLQPPPSNPSSLIKAGCEHAVWTAFSFTSKAAAMLASSDLLEHGCGQIRIPKMRGWDYTVSRLEIVCC